MISPCDKCQFLFNEKRKPFTMKCKHNFCTKCLVKQHKEINLQNSESTIITKEAECPKCKKISVPNYDSILHETIIEGNRYKDVDRIVKISFFGEAGVGKTSLIQRLAKDMFFTESMPTIGIGFSSTKKIVQSNTIFYQFIDTAGTENYRSLFPSQFKDADIGFIVFDVNKNVEENKLKYWVAEVQEKCNTSKIFLLGNQTDLLEDYESNESIKYVEDLCKEKNWKDFCISCKQNIGIGEIWKELNKLAIECEFDRVKSNSVILGSIGKEEEKKISEKKKKLCC